MAHELGPDLLDALREQGINPTTVAELMGDPAPERFAIAQPYRPTVLEGTPELPEPGIYFGMSDEVYHALPALSNTGIKKIAASPMIFWAATSWLSEIKRKREAESQQEEKAHHVFGKAYHCRLMEGASAFDKRFAVALDPADHPDALVSTDQIKAAIGKFTETVPVKPKGRSLTELGDQLTRLGGDPTGLKTDDLKKAISAYTEEAAVKPWRKVPDVLPDDTPYERDAVKADWVRQLLELDPEADIFAVREARHAEENEGRTFIYADQFAELEIAAAMIERDPDPDVSGAFRDGHAEVVLIWYCPRTGVPMKAKIDYLKLRAIVDLKTVGNQRERSIEQAIRWEIASYKYTIQPVVYCEGADAVRALVREHDVNAIHVLDEDMPACEVDEIVGWAMEWAKSDEPDEFMWIFQQKGAAPITRGVKFPRTGLIDEETSYIVAAAKRTCLQYSEVFGTEPWLDTKPAYMIADEDIPRSATEI